MKRGTSWGEEANNSMVSSVDSDGGVETDARGFQPSLPGKEEELKKLACCWTRGVFRGVSCSLGTVKNEDMMVCAEGQVSSLPLSSFSS